MGADDKVFVTRRGRFRRETDVVLHERVQSVRLTQGPLQRRLGLATVHLDTSPGPVHATAAHRPAAEARATCWTPRSRGPGSPALPPGRNAG